MKNYGMKGCKMSKLTDKVVLVTGGSGNIGSYIVERILERNPKQVVIVDNLFNSDKRNLPKDYRIVFYSVDISELESMEYIFNKHRPEYVFHVASMLIQDSEVLPRKAIGTNILGTYNIVDLSNKYGVKKICYSSSASVYGEPKYLPVDEEHPFQYKNFVYGWTKITAEMIFLANSNVEWIGFRYYNVYSERMRVGAFYTQVIPIFYNKIVAGEPITVYGDGSQTMDLIHAKDIAWANILGLESDVTREFFNVGTGIETSVKELAYFLMKEIGATVQIKYIPEDTQKVKNRRAATEKIKKFLNFEPTITVAAGLKRYVESRRDHK